MSDQERGSRPTRVPEWTDTILEAIKYIPAEVLQGLVAVYRRGDEKYGYENWKKGLPYKETLDHVFEHIRQYIADGAYNHEDRLPHLMQAVWGLGTIHYMDQHQDRYSHFDDLHPRLVRHPNQSGVGVEPSLRDAGQSVDSGVDNRPGGVPLAPTSDHPIKARLLDALHRESPFGSRRWPVDYLAVDLGLIQHQQQLTRDLCRTIVDIATDLGARTTQNATGEYFVELV